MDLVQWYYLGLLVLGAGVVLGKAFMTPNKPYCKGTCIEYLRTYALAMVLGLPVIGRMFNWW